MGVFEGLLLHGFVLSVGGVGIRGLTVGAVGGVVFCGVLRLGLSVLSGGHAGFPAETVET